jgi:CRP-like cAMP-binding protein
MTSWAFKSFVLEHPKVAWAMLQTLAQRLRASRL